MRQLHVAGQVEFRLDQSGAGLLDGRLRDPDARRPLNQRFQRRLQQQLEGL